MLEFKTKNEIIVIFAEVCCNFHEAERIFNEKLRDDLSETFSFEHFRRMASVLVLFKKIL